MRLATVNLLGGRSVTTGEVAEDELRATAELVVADVVALQEVDRDQARSHHTDQTAVVADVLGAAHWRFLPTLHGTPGSAWTPASGDGSGAQPPGPSYGIALVSRFPVTEWHVRRFKPAPVSLPLLIPGEGFAPVADEPRAALAAVLDGPAGRLTVIATHLSFVPGWNIAQLREIVRWARTLPAPHVLLGDLNLPGPVVRLTSRWTQAVRLATYPSWHPRVQLDHVLLDGVPAPSVGNAASTRLPISDHRGVAVDLHLG